MKKKMIAMFMAATIVAGMAGCGSKTAITPSGGDAAPEQNASTEAGAETPASTESELNIAVFEGGYGPDYWNQIVSMFEDSHPGVSVKMQINPQIGDIIRPQIAAGQVPDFLVLNDNDTSGVVLSLIKENGLTDLTDVFEGPGIDDQTLLKDQVLDGVLETTKCQPYGDGKIFLAPFNASPMGLVYNKTLFAEKGYELPKTWDDFFALGDQAKKDGYALMTYAGIHPGYMESLLWPALASACGIDTVMDMGRYKEGSFSSEEVMTVLKNIQKIGTEGYLMNGTVALNHTQSQTDMMMNKALFIPNGNWMEGEMADSPRADGFEFGLWTAPTLEADDESFVMTSVEQFSIPAKAQNPEMAKEFLRFLYTDESVKLFAENSNGIYALKDATELSKGIVSDGVYNMNSVYENGTSMVFGFAALPEGSKVVPHDRVFKVMTDIMNGDLSAEDWATGIEASFTEVNAQ